MRIFSQFEKKFLNRIVNLEESNEKLIKPHTLLKGLLNIKSQVTIVGHDYKYQLQDGETYYYKIELLGSPENGIYDDYIEVIDRIHEANDLLNYLLRDGYLIRHNGGHAIGLLINMQDNLVEGENGVEKIEIHINQLLQEFLEKCGYFYKPTEALRDLVKHKFKTQAERNSLWTRVISIASIVIAVVSASSNVYFNSQKSKNTSPQVIKIDSSTVDYFIKKSGGGSSLIQAATKLQTMPKGELKSPTLIPLILKSTNNSLITKQAPPHKTPLTPPAKR